MSLDTAAVAKDGREALRLGRSVQHGFERVSTLKTIGRSYRLVSSAS